MDVKKLLSQKMDRRKVLGNLGMMGAGAVLTACGTSVNGQKPDDEDEDKNMDDAVLNFALNLEYLEAAFYLAAVGRLDELPGSSDIIVADSVRNSNPSENFDDATRQYAEEIAQDELAHVKFLDSALKDAAIERPKIDISAEGAFSTAATAAFRLAFDDDTFELPTPFDPYANGLFFIHGAFIFEDVGVTAYKGAARLITNKDFLEAAAGILAVEAYHSGEIRTLLYSQRETQVDAYGVDVETIVGAISGLRAALGGGKDQGIVVDGKANIVVTDENAIAYSRSTAEVLNIVYGNADGMAGLFFPDGLNGEIK